MITLDCKAPMGLLDGEESAAYHASGAIGSTKISRFMKSEWLFYETDVLGVLHDEPTDAMMLGSAIHALVLEGVDAFNARYATKPMKHDGRTTDGKAWLADNVGKTFLTTRQGALAIAMARAVQSNDVAKEMLRSGRPEVTARMFASRWNLPVQARFDWLFGEDPKHPHIVDLKKTTNLDEFDRAVATFGYQRQASLYPWVAMNVLKLDEPPTFTIVAVEEDEPHRVGIYQLDQSWLDLGWMEVDDALTRMSHRLRNGGWVRDVPGVQTLTVPSWYQSRALKRLDAAAGAA